MQTAAKASIWLASKIEEDVRRPRDVINVFHFLQQQRDGKNTDPIPLDQGKGYKFWSILTPDFRATILSINQISILIHFERIGQ